MRRTVLLAICTLLLAAGCARPEPGPSSGTGPSPVPDASQDVAIYTAVIRRYLTNGNENSFPGTRFPVVYVLDRTNDAAADPMTELGPATARAIAPADQQRIVDGLRGVANVQFVSSRAEVIVTGSEHCEQVRDGGILIVLGPPSGGADRVEVAINGFVACLGATWLTYVVQRGDHGWAVTDTTGPIAVA